MLRTFLPASTVKGLLGTALLSLGALAMAQSAPSASAMPAPGMSAEPNKHGMHKRDPEKMRAMLAQHMAHLKTKLKITAAQEGAWTSFTAAMQPPEHKARMTPEQGAELQKLSTPERIDKMHAMRAERTAEMNAQADKREQAIKTFYAALTPEQQKIFDDAHRKMADHGAHHGDEGHVPKK